jgi:hypothetical protein
VDWIPGSAGSTGSKSRQDNRITGIRNQLLRSGSYLHWIDTIL